MDDEGYQNSLKVILDKLADLSDRTEKAFQNLEGEVQHLKDTRFRPYMTSMGLFVAITLAVTSFVYSIELKFTGAVFELNDRIKENETTAHINVEKIQAIEQRLDARMKRQEAIVDRIDNRIMAINKILVGQSQ